MQSTRLIGRSQSSVSQLRKTIITELVDKVKTFIKLLKLKWTNIFEDKQGIVVKYDFELKLHHQRDNLYQYSMKRLNNVIETKEVLINFESRKHLIDEMKFSVQKRINDIKK